MKIQNLFSYIASIPAIIAYHNKKCHSLIDSDLKSNGVTPNNSGLHTLLVKNKAFRRIFLLRIRGAVPKWLYIVCRIIYKPIDSLLIECPQISEGFTVYHGISTIVFAKSIGRNFTTYQNVTVGRSGMGSDNYPTIGDNVTIYSGAVVAGNIHIGNNVTIGANTFVNKDIPDNCTVVGAGFRIFHK